MNFDVKENLITGKIDIPDNLIYGLSIDSVWIHQDTIFTDHSASIGPNCFYKGVIVAGDSVIDGKWLQSGGAFPLKLKPAPYTPAPNLSNLNPKIEGYRIIKLIESTPIKDQQFTNVCWAYATTSFIETEAIRLGKKPVVLSPMFYVLTSYTDKAEKFIRMKGKSDIGPGGLTFHAMKAYKNYGAIPEEIYSGKTDNSAKHDHYKLDKKLTDRANYYVNSGYGNMTADIYKKDLGGILDRNMGKAPDTFYYNKKKYTPKSFADEVIGINPDDYVEITSFSHHPFYSKFILEMPSNWNNDSYLNLPINDFSNLVDYALLHNFSVCWDADIQDGYANTLNDTLSEVTQKMRQDAFDNYTLVDCHNMHIIGIAENSKGKKFYIVKNSSDFGGHGGYFYITKEYLLLKTISVMVHKDAIPTEIKNSIPFLL